MLEGWKEAVNSSSFINDGGRAHDALLGYSEVSWIPEMVMVMVIVVAVVLIYNYAKNRRRW